MATAAEAALARTACALAAVTDLVEVSNLNPEDCSFDLQPPDALKRGKLFSHHQVQDHQMDFFKDRLARCCPEPEVERAVRQWPPLPAAMEIRTVVDRLAALLLEVPGWNGQCVPPECAG